VTYSTLIDAPNDDKKLKPGMTASIIIYTKEINDAMLVSAKALKFMPDSSLAKEYEIIPIKGLGESGRGGKKGNGRAGAGNASAAGRGSSNGSAPEETTAKPAATYLWLVQGKKLVQKQVKIGLNDNTHVQVLEGLTANDVVATGSEMAMKDSQAAASSPFMPQRPKRR